MPYFISSYAYWTVAASILIGIFASYVTLDLAKRVRFREKKIARAWWLGGSITMGTGIWSMHFMGMIAYHLPISLGYTAPATVGSWASAVLTSAVALKIAAASPMSLARLAIGATVMGCGICGMHYIGMAAIDLEPGIIWDYKWITVSVACAVTASAAALWVFSILRNFKGKKEKLYQCLAAVVMGLAISSTHYSGMAAVNVMVDSICTSADQLGGSQLALFVLLGTSALLGMTLFTSTLDARMQSHTAKLAASLKNVTRELQRRAFLDPLTELPNRLLLEDRLIQAIAKSAARTNTGDHPSGGHGDKHPQNVALLFIDLDGFKPVNDSAGHAVGDLLLKEIANRLRQQARAGDTVARMGGDEFVILLENIADKNEAISIGQRVVQTISRPIAINERKHHIGASVGVAAYPEHGPGDRLMAHADAAMYVAKRAGGGTCVLFERHMAASEVLSAQVRLQNDLRQAISCNQLQLHYQPKLDSRQFRLSGVEALIRWNHPVLGEIPPRQFLPIVERCGLISSLGAWVIDEACRQISQWLDMGLYIKVAINLSVHQLRLPDLISNIDAALRRHKAPPHMLLLEITETVAMEDIAATQRTLAQLSDIGVYISIGDFGTGYSSLAYLLQLPARQVKIDRAFINDLENNPDARAMVDAVIKLAHALDLDVVAEGVETTVQKDILQRLKCDEMQGFYFAKPMSAASLQDWALRENLLMTSDAAQLT